MITKEEINIIQETILQALQTLLDSGDDERLIGVQISPSGCKKNYNERSFCRAMARAVALNYSGISSEMAEVSPDFIKELEDKGFKVEVQNKVGKKLLRVGWRDSHEE